MTLLINTFSIIDPSKIIVCCLMFVVLCLPTILCRKQRGKDASQSIIPTHNIFFLVLSLFNVIKFENGVCRSDTNMNGTCYTPQECETKNGIASGSCASGFGVCCLFTLECGQMSSENNTFIRQNDINSDLNSCAYTICKSSSNICRFRLDFNVFDISGPVSGMAARNGIVPNPQIGDVLGDCITDTFSVSNSNAPVICGFNTGQHSKY